METSSGPAPDRLTVQFESERREVAPGETLGFGRSADLVIDASNRLLHRLLGRFVDHGGQWWLSNEGSTTALVVTDLDGASFVRIAPGSSTPVPFRSSIVSFSAGKANYQLHVEVPRLHGPADLPLEASDTVNGIEQGERTLTVSGMVFNEEQFLLLVAVSEPRLEGPVTSADLPTTRQLAQRLGWSVSKTNRKLDNLCVKLAKVGVAGLAGDTATVATHRRLHLADYAVESGLVTKASLDLLV